MTAYEQLCEELPSNPRRWLVTGVAGFIGSHLLEHLLQLGQQVVGLDNIATGRRENLEEVRRTVGEESWRRFQFIDGDIKEEATCQQACTGCDYVLHQAALGSVPRSIADPIRSYQTNVMGFLNMVVAARNQKVGRFVYASSSSVYGSHPELPKREENIGEPLSPYAATKYFDEVTAGVFARCYGLDCVGLRYFNVFGPRQDPNGPYAAVIPRWIAAMIAERDVVINGDGETSRDFCFVSNVVQANLLAAVGERIGVVNQVYNVAGGNRVSLGELFEAMKKSVHAQCARELMFGVRYDEFRAGDVRHSLADTAKARTRLKYSPTHSFEDGLRQTVAWHLNAHRVGGHPA